MKWLLIISVAVIIWRYILYPFFMAVFFSCMEKPVQKKEIYPFISILLSAYNEEQSIIEKVNHIMHLDYPRDKMEIIVGSDGSTDETYRIVKQLASENKIRYGVAFQRIGKNAMVNKLAKDARGELFVVVDAMQRIERSALKELVSCFADQNVGCVLGAVVSDAEDDQAEDELWFYDIQEKILRKLENAVDSTFVTQGGMYAIRRDMFRYMPDHLILDDVYMAMNVVMLKKRAVFEPLARTHSLLSREKESKFTSIVKKYIGSYQIFSLFIESLNPLKTNVAFQLLSHDLLDLLVPYFAICAFISSSFLLVQPGSYLLIFLIQLIFYCLAFIGFVLRKTGMKKSRIFRTLFIPYEFCFYNYAVLVALQLYFTSNRKVRLKDWVS
ncbi:MAG: glycosyltransferase [Candidatus Omnitrophota bacterium]